MDEVYATARATVDEASMGSLTREIPIERYHWPLGLGLLCLVVEWSIGTRRRMAKTGKNTPLLFLALTLGVLFLTPETTFASPRQAERSYQAGNYAKAIALWSEAAEAKPEDARLHYNLGNAYYRDGQFASAIAAYQKALPLADVTLQERIFYNLGNAQYQLGVEERTNAPARTTELWDESLRNYGNSLAINPDAPDANRNRDWVEREFTTHGSRITVAPAPIAGGTVSGGGLFLPGTILTLEAEARPGWRFVAWHGADVDDPENAKTEMVVQQSAQVLAVFVETRELEVKSEDPAKGTAGKSGRFDLDQDVPIEAEAVDYFVFKQWVSDTLEVADPHADQTTVKLTKNGMVTATFTDAYYLEVVSDPPIAGNVGQTGFFKRHSETPIQAEARDGFEWLGWSGEYIADIADHNAPETTIALNGDRKAIAQFDRIWNLVVLPDRDEAGSTTGGGNFPIGSLRPIEATPSEGYTFLRWEGPGVGDAEAMSTTVQVLSETQDVIAIFEQEDGDDESDSSSDSEEGHDDSESESGDDESSPPEEEPTEPETNEADPAEDETAQEEPVSRETPESLTEEEAQQLLQMLRQDERQLPLRPRSPGDEKPTTGRDW